MDYLETVWLYPLLIVAVSVAMGAIAVLGFSLLLPVIVRVVALVMMFFLSPFFAAEWLFDRAVDHNQAKRDARKA